MVVTNFRYNNVEFHIVINSVYYHIKKKVHTIKEFANFQTFSILKNRTS